MQAKHSPLGTNHRQQPCDHVVHILCGFPKGRVRQKDVVVAVEMGCQEIDPPRAMKSGIVKRQLAHHDSVLTIKRISLLRSVSAEAQTVIGHQPQGFWDVRDNVASLEYALKFKILVGKIVQAVDHKRLQFIIESVSMVGALLNHHVVVVNMRLPRARQDGVLCVEVAFPT